MIWFHFNGIHGGINSVLGVCAMTSEHVSCSFIGLCVFLRIVWSEVLSLAVLVFLLGVVPCREASFSDGVELHTVPTH